MQKQNKMVNNGKGTVNFGCGMFAHTHTITRAYTRIIYNILSIYIIFYIIVYKIILSVKSAKTRFQAQIRYRPYYIAHEKKTVLKNN